MSDKFVFKSGFAVLFGVLLYFAAASLVDARSRGSHSADSHPGHFDYYLTSLSWSPSYCALHPDEPQQCGKGYGFVLHGLWPQNRNGSWPEHCKANGAGPSEETIARTLAIMPSRHLIEHEWETHGACTGLDAKTYFDMADDAFSRIEIPKPLKTPQTPPSMSAAEIVQAFSDVNPGLDETMMTVECRNGSELEEVRICVDKDNLSVKACGGRVRNSCRVGKLTIPAVR
jgi:ribonuclease T2